MRYIIYSYTYDDKMTDMECAYYDVIHYYDDETDSFGSEEVMPRFPKQSTAKYWETDKPIPESIVSRIKELRKKERIDYFNNTKKRMNEELNKINAVLRPNNIGQIVKISSGKYKGTEGKVTWFGKNKFNHSVNTKYTLKQSCLFEIIGNRPYTISHKNDDLICIRPVNGNTFTRDKANGKNKIYINPNNCAVIEGYIPVTVTDDAIKDYCEFNKSWYTKWIGAYNFNYYLKDDESKEH